MNADQADTAPGFPVAGAAPAPAGGVGLDMAYATARAFLLARNRRRRFAPVRTVADALRVIDEAKGVLRREELHHRQAEQGRVAAVARKAGRVGQRGPKVGQSLTGVGQCEKPQELEIPAKDPAETI